MVYYIINEKHQIMAASYEPLIGIKDYKTCEDENFKVSNGFDGAVYFDSYIQTEEYQNLKTAYEEERELKDLRRRREEECFPYINRGELWYKTLTADQITELNAWYEAWLKVTETKVVPVKPEWLK